MTSRFRFFLALLFVLTAISPMSLAAQTTTDVVHGLDVNNMDLSVDPADDFYRFANGGWLDQAEIPDTSGSIGVFDELHEKTTDQLLTLLIKLVASGGLEEGSDEWKAVQLFIQGIDLKTRDENGVDPIQPLLDDIQAIGNLDEFNAFQEEAAPNYLTALFYPYVSPDLKDSSTNVVSLSGPFLGLPNGNYYYPEFDESLQPVVDSYLETCAQLLEFAGHRGSEAETVAEDVFDLEKALVTELQSFEESQDAENAYNPMDLDALEGAYSGMDWESYFDRLGLSANDELIVTEKRYLEALDGILDDTDLDTLKAYVTLEVMWSFDDMLSEDVEEASFEFWGVTLLGVTEQDPLQERVLETVNSTFGEAVGQLYVAEYFPPEAKVQITELVDSIIVAFRERLENNEWLSDETIAIAIEKLDAMGVKVGYPDEWRSYEDVELGDSFVESFMNAHRVDYERQLADVGQAADRDKWFSFPQEVNAHYDPNTNSITFPAAILQAPFFDYQADAAVNFGGIGFVIGHEITHGFDQRGAQYDDTGSLANWWTDDDADAFADLNDEVVDLYSQIEVLPDLFVDGELTVTENVADLGGVQVAYGALQDYLAKNGDPGEIDGFTQNQRFFLSAATIWRDKARDEYLELLVNNDVHSPAVVRATLPSQNLEEFYEAFDISRGDDMFLPERDRIVIW